MDSANEHDNDEVFDPYAIDLVTSKVYDRRIIMHADFEQICNKYWQLLRRMPECDRTSNSVSKHQYTQLMKRVYKVLLPLYREDEMQREIGQEWLYDSRGSDTHGEMNLVLFQKTLYRVAHCWCTHVDLGEYVELLTMVYNRIVVRQVTRGQTATMETAYPRIYVDIFQEKEEEPEEEWQSCLSDEYQQSDYEYTRKEDPEDPMVTKKYKRPKVDNAQDEEENAIMSTREPFYFKEDVVFYESMEDNAVKRPQAGDSECDVLADLGDVYPLGYLAEQFICNLKNEVLAAFIKMKEDRKKAIAEMRRAMFEDGLKAAVNKPPEIMRDPGILDACGAEHKVAIKIHNSQRDVLIEPMLRVKDFVFNSMRACFKDAAAFNLRPWFTNPARGIVKGLQPKKATGPNDPATQINETGYNCALERRLDYQQCSCEMPDTQEKVQKQINVNYLLDDPVFSTVFRSDVTRIETKEKMAVKPLGEGEQPQRHEFCNVTTSYKELLTVVLSTKFQTLFADKMGGRQTIEEQNRDAKVCDAEKAKKAQVLLPDGLVSKNVSETYDEKNYLKLMKGPFYALESKAGSVEDDFAHCVTRDLIETANAEKMRLLLLGKPRCGKTELAKRLAKALGLVRISKQTWIDELYARIKDREENPPEDEEEEEEEEEEEKQEEEIEEKEEGDEDGSQKGSQEGEPKEGDDQNEEAKKAEEAAKPKEPEVPVRPKKDRWLTDLEYLVRNCVRDKQPIDVESVEQMLRMQIASEQAQVRGYILDLSFGENQPAPAEGENNESEEEMNSDEFAWATRLMDNDILPEGQTFTHIVDLAMEDDEVKLRASGMRMDPKTGKVYSRAQIMALRKPKKEKKIDDEGNEMEEEEEAPEEDDDEEGADPDRERPGSLDEEKLVERAEDSAEAINKLVEFYNMRERTQFDEFILKMHESTFLKIDVAGLDREEIADSVLCKLKPDQTVPNTPIAEILEDGGEGKDILTAGIEVEGQLPRRWSLWKNTDPVALRNGKVEEGSSEFAATFANTVFLFESEENRNAFVKAPLEYISEEPQMPPNFRLMMVGPKGIGVHTQADRLEQFYGWRVVDFQQIVSDKLSEILMMNPKPRNNIEGRKSAICLSEKELQEIKEGKPFATWKFIPWILEHLNIPLDIKDPPPPDPETEPEDDWTPEQLADFEKKKQKKEREKKKEQDAKEAAAKEKAAAKEERAARRASALENGENLEALGLAESSDEESDFEDCSIERFVPAKDEEGNTKPINSFIMIGFPQTEAHCEKLKDFGIEFDRVLNLADAADEDDENYVVGAAVTERMNAVEGSTKYEYEQEVETANAVMAVVREFLGEDNAPKAVLDVTARGSEDAVFMDIRKKLDPFFTQVDNPDMIKVSADYEEQEEEPRQLPKSDFGDFCPVTFVQDNFLVRGNYEFESFVFGKRYVFAGEEQKKLFDNDPAQFMIAQEQGADLPILPPTPKIMVFGEKCSGATSQINMLCDKYKLESLELFKTYWARREEELKKRQRQRLLKRGYKGIAEPEDEDAEVELDTEVLEDPEEFDKAKHEIELLQLIIDTKKGLVIDGNWTENPEENGVEEPLQDLLLKARRTPEIVLMLKCKEEVSIERWMKDNEENLKEDFEKQMKEREANRLKAREEARLEKKKELEEREWDEEMNADAIEKEKAKELADWEEERDQTEADDDENDDEKPDLEKMKEEAAEKIREQRAKDEEMFATIKETLQTAFVEVIEIDTSKLSAEFVQIKLLDQLKNNFTYRQNMVERQLAAPLKPEEVKFYEQSFYYRPSKFGYNSPLSPANLQKTKQFTVLYRERLYFLANESERKKFLLEPSRYVKNCEAHPSDVNYKFRIVVQGSPKSGKTELCERIISQTGAVHLQMDQIVDFYMDRDSVFSEKLRSEVESLGKDRLDDLMLVNLLQRRTQVKDCATRGWVLEGFPQTRSQAILMARKGLNPTSVLVLHISQEETFKRARASEGDSLDCEKLAQRVKDSEAMFATMYFYQKVYNSVSSVDAHRSKWFVHDVALEAIRTNLLAKMNFARDLLHASTPAERPCAMANLNIDRVYMKQSLSQFGHFCPVSFRNENRFVSCTHRPELTVLYKNFFYYFASKDHRDIFIKNPKRFTENILFADEGLLPSRFKHHKAAEIAETPKSLSDYCPVTLKDEEKLVKGNSLLMVTFEEEKYIMASEEKLQRFFSNPQRYFNVKLPVRIPPEEKPVLLYNLQKEDNSITFLEQALGSVVTKGLREIGEQRIKYPTLSVKETMLKAFALFLKTENPANTPFMKDKYRAKLEEFLQKCTVPEELSDLADEKVKKTKKDKWPQFKENYYNSLGTKYDRILKEVEKEKSEGFSNYVK